MKKILIFSIFIAVLLLSFVSAESRFNDRTTARIENCAGCSYDGKCVEIGAAINPDMYCVGNYIWEKKKFMNLSNGRNAEIKIMPETASATAIGKLGELNFTVELKEVGKGNETKAVYELTGNKEGKFLGIFKIMASEKVQIDAETGEVVKVIKPWWSFLATGI